MPINVDKQIQEAMARGDFKNLPGKGKLQKLARNPFIPYEVWLTNQILKDSGFSPRWIEVDKEIRTESAEIEKLLSNIKERRKRLANLIRVNPFKFEAIQGTFELERTRALQAYSTQLKGLNQKIQRFNLMMPVRGKQQRLHNLVHLGRSLLPVGCYA